MNYIKGLRNDQGVWCKEIREIDQITSDYYRNIFSSSNPTQGDMVKVLSRMPNKVTDYMNKGLLKVFNAQKIRKVSFHMHSLKSLGPDGMS